VPGVNRVLRAAAVAAAAATVALVAGCGAGQIPGHGRLAADAATPAGSRPAPSKAAEATPTPTATVSGESVTLGKATIPLAGVARATRNGDYLCLTLGDDTGCSLEIVDLGATRRAGGSVSIPAPGQPKGWWWGSDPASCGGGAGTSPIAASTVVDKGFRKVGPKTAAYGYWRVTCENSELDFDPRLWWLPNTMIAFREHSTGAGTAAAVDRILAGVTFGA
jgi:hypothetical protein